MLVHLVSRNRSRQFHTRPRFPCRALHRRATAGGPRAPRRRSSGQRDEKVRRHVAELLAWVGLAEHLDSYPPTLSGGQKQRVAIARAVVGRPSLLIADEPTGNVDDRMAVRLLYLFEELNKLGTTIMIASHNESLVARFNHPVVRLIDGGATFSRAVRSASCFRTFACSTI